MSDIDAGRDAINVVAGRDAVNILVNTGDHFCTGTASGSQNVRQDAFRPSFHAPSNPTEVILDFGDPLNGREPQTQEAKVLHELLREDCDQSSTRVVTVHGKGGVGKSCILRALAGRKDLKERFPDGIFFLSLGMDASMGTLIQGLSKITQISGGQVLGTELRGDGSFEIVLQKVREWMKGRNCLLLVDDFWEENGVGADVVTELAEIFSEGSGSMVVVTTRFSGVATKGNETVEIKELETTSEKAKDILLVYSKFDRSEVNGEKVRQSFMKLLKMCGGLPVFLAVVGKGVAKLALRSKGGKGVAWVRYSVMVEDTELLETNVDGYKDLGKTLQVSLKLVSEDCGKRFKSLTPYSFQEMHRAFCVFTKQAAIPISVCRRLWRVRSNGAALKIGNAFADVGLADIGIEGVAERSVAFMRLHDLVHIFAVESANQRNEISRWHERLLQAYISISGDGESIRRWWEFEEESGEEYLFENVCRHLARSGNIKELGELLLSGEWSQFRHKNGGLSAWKHDCSEYLGRQTIATPNKSEKEVESGLRMVRDAVIESWVFVHENLQELGFQIFGRLVDCKNEFVRKYLESIERVQCGPWLKPIQRLWRRPGEGGMIAEFHLGDYIFDVAVQKDPFIAAAAVRNGVVIIDLKEMTVISRCTGHTREARKVRIDTDRRRVFSWSRDGDVRQWDVQSGQEDTDKYVRLRDEDSDKDRLWCAAFCLEKSFVITGSRNGRLKVWDLSSGERIGHTMYVTECVRSIEVSPNGQIIAAGVHGGAVLLWDVESFPLLGGKIVSALSGVYLTEFLNVTSIAFSPDDRYVAFAGGRRHRTIQVWNAENRTQIRELLVDWNNGVYSVTFSENGQQIISGHLRSSITVWDVASGAAIRSWDAHSGSVGCVAVTRDCDVTIAVAVNSRRSVGGGMECIMRVWDLEAAGSVKDKRIQHSDEVSCVAASPDGRFFASASRDKTLRIWDAFDGTALSPALCGHEKWVTCVAVSPDSRRVVSGSEDCTVRLWDVATGVQVGDALRGHKEEVNCVAYSWDGRFVVSGSHDCTARVWRVIDNLQRDENVCEYAGKRVNIAEDGVCEELSSRESVRLEMTLHHKVPSGAPFWKLSVLCVAVSPDGQRVLSGLHGGGIWVWDTICGECIYQTRSNNDGYGLVRMEISNKNEVLTMNERDKESRWQLDDEGGLTRVPENESTLEIAQAEAQGGSACSSLTSISCNGRTVELSGSGMKIATLSEEVRPKAWKYNVDRSILCAGLRDGRVMLFRLEC